VIQRTLWFRGHCGSEDVVVQRTLWFEGHCGSKDIVVQRRLCGSEDIMDESLILKMCNVVPTFILFNI
jgi:hypothetical protein